MPGPFKYACTINKTQILLRTSSDRALFRGEIDKPSFNPKSYSLSLSFFSCKLVWSPSSSTLWHSTSLPFLFSLCVSPALQPESEQTMTQIQKRKKKNALLSAVFDNLSLRGSLIIHASLTGYLLSFCISLLKRMSEVEGYMW